MTTIDSIQNRLQQLQVNGTNGKLTTVQQQALEAFNRMGIPTGRHEEWKYTRIGSIFNKPYAFPEKTITTSLTAKELADFRLPGYEEANELVFVNGMYDAALSVIRSSALVIFPLEVAAANEYKEIVSKHLAHSNRYVKDGIHALNTAFVKQGIFVHIRKGQVAEHPICIYHVTDARSANIFSQPRTLLHIGEQAEVQLVETSVTIGMPDNFSSHVMEVVVEKDANLEYYKIQNDVEAASQVSTTLLRQVGKSYVHTVTISLNGNIVRNNLNIALEAEHAEANLHGLYFLKGQSHIDNHTVVDHVKPNCLSNELYKGIIDDNGTAVFNGKIFVQPDAQKTNAFQSNKNILLSEFATVNTKPQLEIFADDVKCSHGCTVGRLDEEGMFYLRSRGISEKIARSLLVHAFAVDILEHIKPEILRNYIDQLISERLEFDIS